MSHPLAKLPIEILAQITGHLQAHDVVRRLRATGNNELLERLRNGGITSWNDDGYGDIRPNINFVRHLRKLTTVTLNLSSGMDLEKLYVRSLSSTVRHLSIRGLQASEVFRFNEEPTPSWDSTLLPIGVSKSANKIWVVRDSFPNLQTLRVTEIDDETIWDDEFSLVRILLGLPPSLQDLELPFKFDCGLNIFEYLPPNLTSLHNIFSALPASYPGLASLVHLDMRIQSPLTACLALPPYLTHLSIPSTSQLLLPTSIPLPPTLTNFKVYNVQSMGRTRIVRPFDHVLGRLPPSVTRTSIFLSFQTPTEDTIRQLESFQPLQHLKHFKLEFYCGVAAELESALWTQLLRLMPNVEDLRITASSSSTGVEPKSLAMLKSSSLRSLTLPLSDECFTITNGPSYLQSAFPGLTDLCVSSKTEDQIVEFSGIPSTVTALNVAAPVSVASLLKLPKSVTQLNLANMVVDEWNDEICALFSAVRTANGELIAVDSSSKDASNANYMRIDASSRFSIDSEGHQMFIHGSSGDTYIDGHESGYLYTQWEFLPTHLPSSLTEFTTSEECPASLLNPQMLPNLKILTVPFMFAGIELFETLVDLNSTHRPSADTEAAVLYPPNLTRLLLRSVTQKGHFPASITHLQASYYDTTPDLSSLPSLRTLILEGRPLWTLNDLPATVTHLTLRASLADADTLQSDSLQRLSNLLIVDLEDEASFTVVSKLLNHPSFPSQAILKCGRVSFTWTDLEAITPRIDGLEAPLFDDGLESCASIAVRLAYPQLKAPTIYLSFDRETDLTAQVWSTLSRFLPPSISYLELPQFPVGDGTTKILWPPNLTSLLFRHSGSEEPLSLPSTLQVLRIHGAAPPVASLLDYLPPSLTYLETSASDVSDVLTNWPPNLKYLDTEIYESGAESIKHLPSTLEWLGLGSVDFDLAQFLPASLKCLEAEVDEANVSSLLKRTQETGCLWVTSQKIGEAKLHETALNCLVSQLRQP